MAGEGVQFLAGLAVENGHLFISGAGKQSVSCVVECNSDEYALCGMTGDGGSWTLVGNIEQFYQPVTSATGQEVAVVVERQIVYLGLVVFYYFL